MIKLLENIMTSHIHTMLFFKKSLPEDMFIDLRERERQRKRERERKRETSVSCLPYAPQPRTEPAT